MNRVLATVAIILLPLATPAAAFEMAAPVSRQLYTCEGPALSRVAARTPAPCCEGQLSCPQLLANTGFTRPRRSNRT